MNWQSIPSNSFHISVTVPPMNRPTEANVRFNIPTFLLVFNQLQLIWNVAFETHLTFFFTFFLEIVTLAGSHHY